MKKSRPDPAPDLMRDLLAHLRVVAPRLQSSSGTHRDFERRRIEQALRETDGNLIETARILRMSLGALTRKLRRFGLNG